MQARARAQLTLALKMLEASLPLIGASSEEGKGLVAAIKALAPIVPTMSPGLLESETTALKQGIQPPGAAAPPQGGMPGMTPQGPVPARMGGGF